MVQIFPKGIVPHFNGNRPMSSQATPWLHVDDVIMQVDKVKGGDHATVAEIQRSTILHMHVLRDGGRWWNRDEGRDISVLGGGLACAPRVEKG